MQGFKTTFEWKSFHYNRKVNLLWLQNEALTLSLNLVTKNAKRDTNEMIYRLPR